MLFKIFEILPCLTPSRFWEFDLWVLTTTQLGPRLFQHLNFLEIIQANLQFIIPNPWKQVDSNKKHNVKGKSFFSGMPGDYFICGHWKQEQFSFLAEESVFQNIMTITLGEKSQRLSTSTVLTVTPRHSVTNQSVVLREARVNKAARFSIVGY